MAKLDLLQIWLYAMSFLLLISAALMLVIFAGPLANWTKATAEQLSNPAPYLESLLGKDAAPETAPPLKGDVS